MPSSEGMCEFSCLFTRDLKLKLQNCSCKLWVCIYTCKTVSIIKKNIAFIV